jgi:hypothetical protein
VTDGNDVGVAVRKPTGDTAVGVDGFPASKTDGNDVGVAVRKPERDTVGVVNGLSVRVTLGNDIGVAVRKPTGDTLVCIDRLTDRVTVGNDIGVSVGKPEGDTVSVNDELPARVTDGNDVGLVVGSEVGESISTADHDEAMRVGNEKKKANERKFKAMDLITRMNNIAIVAETNQKIIRTDYEEKRRSAISSGLKSANTEMAIAADLAVIEAHRRTLRMGKCSNKSLKLLHNNPAPVLPPTQVNEEVPRIHLSQPLPLGGKACMLTNPHDADHDARESLKRKRILEEDDDSSKINDSTHAGNEGIDRFQNDPRLHKLIMLGQTNLKTLQLELKQLAHRAPDLLRAINQNHGKFLALMTYQPKTHVVMKSNEKYYDHVSDNPPIDEELVAEETMRQEWESFSKMRDGTVKLP